MSQFLLSTTGGVLLGSTAYYLLQSKFESDAQLLQTALRECRRTVEEIAPLAVRDPNALRPTPTVPDFSLSEVARSILPDSLTPNELSVSVRPPSVTDAKEAWNTGVQKVGKLVIGMTGNA